jgi:hypothetical protein
MARAPKPANRTEPANSAEGESSGRLLEPLPGPELVFGLVGPIGTDMKLVSRKLSEELKKVGYTAVEIRVSDSLKEFSEFALKESPVEERYRTYMNAGNKFRQKLRRQDALALLAVVAIRRKRFLIHGNRRAPKQKTAYILSQFKRPEEIATLRRVYGRGFIQISAYCSREKRLDDLTAPIHDGAAINESVRVF